MPSLFDSFRLPSLHSALDSDKLFCFRIDEKNELTMSTTIKWLESLKITKMLICSEVSSDVGKPHHHGMCAIPFTYKNMEKEFLKYVKFYKLCGSDFSKKKSDPKTLTKSKEFDQILKDHSMDYIDYLPLYMCKDLPLCEAEHDSYYNTMFDLPVKEFYNRYTIIQGKRALIKTTKKQATENHMKTLIRLYGKTDICKEYRHVDYLTHMNTRPYTLQTAIYNFVVDYFVEVNLNKPLAQLLNHQRLTHYAFTIFMTYYPNIYKEHMIKKECNFMELYN